MPITPFIAFRRPLGGLALAAAVLLISACGGGGSSPQTPVAVPDVPADTSPWGLRATTESELTTWLREALGTPDQAYLRTRWSINIGYAADATAAAGGEAVFSGTTLQEKAQECLLLLADWCVQVNATPERQKRVAGCSSHSTRRSVTPTSWCFRTMPRACYSTASPHN